MSSGDRIMIVSIPRAGTALLAGVLTRLGHAASGLLVHPESYERHTAAIPSDRDPVPRRVRCPWQETLDLVGPGQFAVSHLPFDRVRLDALRGFRVLFLKREPRQCLVSQMRWTLGTRRRERYPGAPWLEGDRRSRVVEFIKDRGWTLSKLYRSLLPWNDADGVEVVRFEDLAAGGPEGLLGHPAGAVARAVTAARGEAAVTGTDSDTDIDDDWSDRAEAVYRLLFKDLDRRLGYRPAPHGNARLATF